ncbi:GNAT family N-acetyltransferase [Mangrovibacillus cuniculi]|uniref:GNAT family N-acetyltransferase n=1 Tax=Mangrovibacillus cuniculi TaxID=2593652 RepID=A0A7S8HFS2_9BACI|nr:GNAT family N-acetyltransferase [Mangrovibacillus cuniculi]QPC47123.1 GNAT family N-acetyltransferase [Mangrovibacillus cuniculi]
MKIKKEYLCSNHIEMLLKFKCKDEEFIEQFLKNEALSLTEKNLIQTVLFIKGDNIVGFYSLFNDSISIDGTKRRELKIKLQQGKSVVPTVNLHYLATNEDFRGIGIGTMLLEDAILTAAKVSVLSGMPIIILESTNSAKGFYQKNNFIHIRKSQCGRLSIMAKNLSEYKDYLFKRFGRDFLLLDAD